MFHCSRGRNVWWWYGMWVLVGTSRDDSCQEYYAWLWRLLVAVIIYMYTFSQPWSHNSPQGNCGATIITNPRNIWNCEPAFMPAYIFFLFCVCECVGGITELQTLLSTGFHFVLNN